MPVTRRLLSRLGEFLLVAAVVGTLAACGAKGDCDKIVEHTFEIGVAERTMGLSDAQRKQVVEQALAARSEALEQCKKRKPSKQQEECALAATTLSQLAACK